MKQFLVTLRKPGQIQCFYAPAFTAAAAYDQVAATQGDEVFGITVVPA